LNVNRADGPRWLEGLDWLDTLVGVGEREVLSPHERIM